jgi:hypothetical protein
MSTSFWTKTIQQNKLEKQSILTNTVEKQSIKTRPKDQIFNATQYSQLIENRELKAKAHNSIAFHSSKQEIWRIKEKIERFTSSFPSSMAASL